MPESGRRALATWLATLLAAGLPLLALWPFVGNPLRMYLTIPWTLAFWAALPFAAFALPALDEDPRDWAGWSGLAVVAGSLFLVLREGVPPLAGLVGVAAGAPHRTSGLVLNGAAVLGGLALVGLVFRGDGWRRRDRQAAVAAGLLGAALAAVGPDLAMLAVAAFVGGQLVAAGALVSPDVTGRTFGVGVAAAGAAVLVLLVGSVVVLGRAWPPRLALSGGEAEVLTAVAGLVAVGVGSAGFAWELAGKDAPA